jgi:hypothetical protein
MEAMDDGGAPHHPAEDSMNEVLDDMELAGDDQAAAAVESSSGFFHTDMLIPLLLLAAFAYFIFQVRSFTPPPLGPVPLLLLLRGCLHPWWGDLVSVCAQRGLAQRRRPRLAPGVAAPESADEVRRKRLERLSRSGTLSRGTAA